jgi:HSP20 family protein
VGTGPSSACPINKFLKETTMAVIRWEPTRELHSLQHEMNRLFGTFLETPGGSGSGSSVGRQWVPAMDLVEREEQFVLRADLPGVREQDVTIEVEDAVLTVAGERHGEHEERREGYHRIERATGSFRRSVTLPEGIDAGSIGARFDAGVLEVTIPKPTHRKPQRVRISLGGEPAPSTGDGAVDAEPAAATA